MRLNSTCIAGRQYEWLLGALAAVGLLAGCATSPSTGGNSHTAPSNDSECDSQPVIRYGRYTLIELAPHAMQADLMQQVVDVTIPASADPTVGDAVRYVLRRSGYQLCEDDEAIKVLDVLPLPAAQIHIGPVSLRDGLTLLVGHAGRIEIREETRRVCLSRDLSDLGGTAALVSGPAP